MELDALGLDMVETLCGPISLVSLCEMDCYFSALK